MAQLHIYLCCGGGLSSGFLAQKARAAAKKSKVNATIEAVSIKNGYPLYWTTL